MPSPRYHKTRIQTANVPRRRNSFQKKFQQPLDERGDFSAYGSPIRGPGQSQLRSRTQFHVELELTYRCEGRQRTAAQSAEQLVVHACDGERSGPSGQSQTSRDHGKGTRRLRRAGNPPSAKLAGGDEMSDRTQQKSEITGNATSWSATAHVLVRRQRRGVALVSAAFSSFFNNPNRALPATPVRAVREA